MSNHRGGNRMIAPRRGRCRGVTVTDVQAHTEFAVLDEGTGREVFRNRNGDPTRSQRWTGAPEDVVARATRKLNSTFQATRTRKGEEKGREEIYIPSSRRASEQKQKPLPVGRTIREAMCLIIACERAHEFETRDRKKAWVCGAEVDGGLKVFREETVVRPGHSVGTECKTRNEYACRKLNSTFQATRARRGRRREGKEREGKGTVLEQTPNARAEPLRLSELPTLKPCQDGRFAKRCSKVPDRCLRIACERAHEFGTRDRKVRVWSRSGWRLEGPQRHVQAVCRRSIDLVQSESGTASVGVRPSFLPSS
ncbi:hypothetical protein B0H14DRAFT_2624072 [Mycena olivaceomarginata]|nr:hypothetical protein B0H14DRAFT_2624072 [Mycena olivaceomarginata]